MFCNCKRRSIAVTVAAVLLWCLCVPTAAEDDLAGPHAFDDGLQVVRGLLDDGKCKQGVKELQALLETHTKKDYAKARRGEVEQLMRELACGVKLKRPKAKDLVSGQLLRWSPRSGKITIKYTPKTSQDFEKRDGLLFLPYLSGERTPYPDPLRP